MTDYTNLVKALRYCKVDYCSSCLGCPMYADYDGSGCINEMHDSAAAAIEALQAENADIREELFISQRKYDEFTTIASMQNAMLAKQLPKRGEIVRCRECKHYNAGFECLAEGYGIERDPDWFCADGEREVRA